MSDVEPKSTVPITQIIHDLRSRTSYVTVVWNDQQEKKLGLPIPFGTKIEDIEAETRKTIQTFSGELATVSIKVP